MKTKQLSQNILIVRARTGSLVKVTATTLMIIGLLLMASMAGFLLGIVLFSMSLVFVAVSAFSMFITIDKNRGVVRCVRRFMFLSVQSRRILLEDIDRIELVVFSSSTDQEKASDAYFVEARRRQHEERAAYAFAYNVGIRTKNGQWQMLSHTSSSNRDMYERVANEINAFLSKKTVYSAQLST